VRFGVQTIETHSELVCCQCGQRYRDRRLTCGRCPEALLRTVYRSRLLAPGEGPGIFRFACWLPGTSALPTVAGPMVTRAEAYGRRLGLRDLSIAFGGYWPERGAFNPTGSFKDLEAVPTVAYLRDHGVEAIVLASAGNTARAFAHACCEHALGCYLVVPEAMFHRLWLPIEQAPWVKAIVLRGSNDYQAAIQLSEAIACRFGIPHEGGARNVARRDGIGTTLLEYVRILGAMPDHYVQAVGSGVGGVALYEAAQRLVEDGRFGSRLPRLHLVQNQAWAPIHEAWSARRHRIDEGALDGKGTAGLYADVLAHRRPPYHLAGGVRAALEQSRGETYGVGSAEARRAKATFEEAEGVSITEAAACACAGLEQGVASGRIPRGEAVLLNITGGGEDRIHRDHRTRPMHASFVAGIEDVRIDGIEEAVRRAAVAAEEERSRDARVG
jgi:cysteate synthase